MRATSEEEVVEVEAVVVETNCGREVKVAATTTGEDSELSRNLVITVPIN